MRIAAVVALLCVAACAADISLEVEPDTGTVRVRGLPNAAEPRWGWAAELHVGVAGPGLPEMSGTYTWEEGALVFRPRYPLAAGVEYRATYCIPGCERAPIIFFRGPPLPGGDAARLERVYPSAAVLPENLLKFYLVFSQPMSRGSIWDHIELVRRDGTRVVLPFLEIDQELWDRDNRRLTVLIDPGRIKRGVTPREEMGPALEERESYTLVVDAGMLDARGKPMAESFRKDFLVGPAAREGIDPGRWKVSSPAGGTREPLVLEFGRPLDFALLQHVFAVKNVAGDSVVDGGETRWTFTPAQPWVRVPHELVIDVALEDLAGNRIGRPFDVDVFDRVTERISVETTTLPFEVR